MTAFAAAINVLFADANLGADASYDPVAGSAFPVRVVKNARRAEQSFSPYATAAVATAYQFDVRVSDVAQPAAGDTLTVGGAAFVVRSFELDGEKLVWQLNVDEAG